jgi:hypothetical protein
VRFPRYCGLGPRRGRLTKGETVYGKNALQNITQPDPELDMANFLRIGERLHNLHTHVARAAI